MSKLNRILRLALGAYTVLLLAALSFICVNLYKAGNASALPPFSRENISLELIRLVPLFVGYIVVLALAVLFGKNEGSAQTSLGISPQNRLLLLKRGLGTLPEKAEREERHRRVLKWLLAAALALFSVPCLAYLLSGDNFSSWELEEVMSALVLRLSPWLTAAFVSAAAVAYICDASIKREIAVLKESNVEKEGAAAPDVPENSGRLRLSRAIILVIAVLFITLGVLNGGMNDVLIKAINICTECIGLG